MDDARTFRRLLDDAFGHESYGARTPQAFCSIAIVKRLAMTLERNPSPEPAWFQTVGVLVNPRS
jgi:hypothetical protein